jgi:hypothetical protein
MTNDLARDLFWWETVNDWIGVSTAYRQARSPPLQNGRETAPASAPTHPARGPSR